MYLRVTQRQNKGGEVVRYVQLAHNEGNERGVPVARIIHTFGREDEVASSVAGAAGSVDHPVPRSGGGDTGRV